MYVSCMNFVLIVELCVPSLYRCCIYNMYTNYVSCIQNVQKYVQNTYRLNVMVAVFLSSKPPPSTTQNGMFLSYDHHENLKNNISIYTKCIQNILANIQNVYKI